LGQNEFLLVRELTEENGTRRALTIDDLTLQQRLKAGTIVQEDINCDSNYMLDAMPRIGAAIRQKLHWVPDDEIIYLGMDNAGGHGTFEAVEQCTRNLLENYNIEIIHQPPRSPETNPLDLGVWRSIQSLVEKKQYDNNSRCSGTISDRSMATLTFRNHQQCFWEDSRRPSEDN
jgi:hypothetical protein